MIDEIIDRLNRLLTGKRDEQWGHDSKELRAMIEAHKAEKEAELTAVQDAMDELDYMDAMADSFALGPEGGEEA